MLTYINQQKAKLYVRIVHLLQYQITLKKTRKLSVQMKTAKSISALLCVLSANKKYSLKYQNKLTIVLVSNLNHLIYIDKLILNVHILIANNAFS